MDLTDEQWSFIEPILPKKKVRKDKKGRPWQDDRKIFNGFLWILRTGAQWSDCRGGTHHIKHAIVDFKHGLK